MYADTLTPRQQYIKRHLALKTERATWDPHWRDLSDYIQPRRSRFFWTEANKGTKKNQYIINSTPTYAARVLAAGMMAGITSPARPWFRLTTPDPGMAEFGPVRAYLHMLEERLRWSFAVSNIYKALPLVYMDLGTFGTSAMLMEDDAAEFFRAYVFPIGSYCLANNEKMQVDTIYRETTMTVAQLVSKFGLEKCSSTVQHAHEQGMIDAAFPVLHVIEPNPDAKRGGVGTKHMKFRSAWLELGANSSSANVSQSIEGLLRDSGYEEFPVMAPRWALTGEDVYGYSPGMEALGDARAIQQYEKRKAQAVDKIVNPPMRGPSSLRNQRASLLPGDTTYVDAIHPGQTFAPAMEINAAAIPAVGAEIREHAERVKMAYFADLWLMLSQSDNPQMTAREVAERHEEKMLQLGPVLQQLEDELLEPMIDRALAVLFRNGDLPPPPQELQGVDLKVEYISIMAQAQKLLATSGIERLAAFTGNLVAVKADAMDKLNVDEIVDKYADALGVPPDLVRTDEEVAAIRQERAKAQQAAAAQEQAVNMAQGAKVLSEADTSSDNALTRIMGQYNGTPGILKQ